MFTCVCYRVTETELREAIARGADSLGALSMQTGAGTNCGSCIPLLVKLLEHPELPVIPLTEIRRAGTLMAAGADEPLPKTEVTGPDYIPLTPTITDPE